MGDKTYKVRCYMEYEIEAPNEEEAILRIANCIKTDLEENEDIREIAEVHSEKISDTGIED